MGEKRRISTRTRETSWKQRETSTPLAIVPKLQIPATAHDEVEGLPTRLKEGQTLPTCRKPQDRSLRNYQSIFESGVLAASVEQSRQKWVLEGGVLDRYWTKPPRKVKGEAPVVAPSKGSLGIVELGPCTMTVEPHLLEVTLYGVKKPSLTWQAPLQGPPSGVQTSAYKYGPYLSQGPYQGPPPVSSASTSIHPYTLPPLPGQSDNHDPRNQPSLATVSSSADVKASAPKQPVSVPVNGNTVAQNANSDPVIQMLAARATASPELKTLMKIVAASKASQDQLREFQSHIDELNAIVRARKHQPSADTGQSVLVPPGTPQSQQLLPSQPTHNVSVPQVKSQAVPPYHAPGSSYLQAKPQPPSRQEFSDILLDFVRCGDCYVLPRNSIVEYLPGNMHAIISFLVIRKDSAAKGENSASGLEHYTPVTITLHAKDPRILAHLGMVVAPADQVHRHMSDIMSKMSRMPEVFLATRLPRAQEEMHQDRPEDVIDKDLDSIMTTYEPPSSLISLPSLM